MPPKIALFLCILFIIYLFVTDFKRNPNVSISLWIPMIWLLIKGSRPVVQWLNPGSVIVTGDDIVSGDPIGRTIYVILIIIGLYILSRREKTWLTIIKSNRWIVLLFLYCGMSILWSDFPWVSFKRLIKGLGIIIMVLIVVTEPNPIEAVKTILRRCAYILIPLSVLFCKYFPHLGVGWGQWGHGPFMLGVTNNKNSLGRVCLVLGFYFFWQIVSMWRNKNTTIDKKELFVHALILLMISWLLIKAQSATSIGCFVIGSCVLIGLCLPIVRRNVTHIGIFIFLAFSIFVILQLSLDVTELFVTSLGRDLTFTDRTFLWKDLINMNTNPLIGTGYESFWLGDRLTILWDKYWWKPTEAHNGILEAYLELGLIGLFLWTGVIFSTYRNICKTLTVDFEFGIFRMVFLFIFLLYNVTEAALNLISFLWFVFLLITLNYPFTSQIQIIEYTDAEG